MQKQNHRADGRERQARVRPRRGRHRLALFALGAPGAAMLETLEPRRLLAADVVISEFLASNDNSILDSFGNREDWIEIHNAGDAPANLNDYYLTDSAATPTKWRFPIQNIAPGEYLVVFASNRNLAVAGQELHTNFALGAGGEYLGLIRASDLGAQFEYAPSFPPQSSDVSYGLFNSDDRNSARISFPVPTPGVANVPTATAAAFSQPGKGFTGTLPVELTSPTPGAQIYYTTNNTVPTTASTPYTGPINLTATTLIRAIVVAPGYGNSLVTSQSYIAVDGTVSSFSWVRCFLPTPVAR